MPAEHGRFQIYLAQDVVNNLCCLSYPSHDHVAPHMAVWCRSQGHDFPKQNSITPNVTRRRRSALKGGKQHNLHNLHIKCI